MKIAAITFTEAAAAEMSTRVGQALARIQRATAGGTVDAAAMPLGLVLEALPADARVLYRRARALRAALDHLNVGTIHAFCRRLLAAHPLAIGASARKGVCPNPGESRGGRVSVLALQRVHLHRHR